MEEIIDFPLSTMGEEAAAPVWAFPNIGASLNLEGGSEEQDSRFVAAFVAEDLFVSFFGKTSQIAPLYSTLAQGSAVFAPFVHYKA
jgi:hypothetical protein